MISAFDVLEGKLELVWTMFVLIIEQYEICKDFYLFDPNQFKKKFFTHFLYENTELQV